MTKVVDELPPPSGRSGSSLSPVALGLGVPAELPVTFGVAVGVAVPWEKCPRGLADPVECLDRSQLEPMSLDPLSPRGLWGRWDQEFLG
jgi:hypothetical protein